MTPETGPTCPACDRVLYSRHCKYVCPNHGVVFDCSDPFWT
ncbi:MAG: HVO_2523 family zinc finger protein [Halodesulfurarchaeum sp.]|nr:HVO_2523 family zinc finger protein [Halodesulfurarchaeum sp.]